MPTNTTAASILTLSSGNFITGDIFYSPFFAAPVIVFTKTLDSTYYVAYTNASDFSTGFSVYQKTWEAPTLGGSNDHAYSQHSYPHWDPTGRSLLVSWAEEGEYVRMANISFKAVAAA